MPRVQRFCVQVSPFDGKGETLCTDLRWVLNAGVIPVGLADFQEAGTSIQFSQLIRVGETGWLAFRPYDSGEASKQDSRLPLPVCRVVERRLKTAASK